MTPFLPRRPPPRTTTKLVCCLGPSRLPVRTSPGSTPPGRSSTGRPLPVESFGAALSSPAAWGSEADGSSAARSLASRCLADTVPRPEHMAEPAPSLSSDGGKPAQRRARRARLEAKGSRSAPAPTLATSTVTRRRRSQVDAPPLMPPRAGCPSPPSHSQKAEGGKSAPRPPEPFLQIYITMLALLLATLAATTLVSAAPSPIDVDHAALFARADDPTVFRRQADAADGCTVTASGVRLPLLEPQSAQTNAPLPRPAQSDDVPALSAAFAVSSPPATSPRVVVHPQPCPSS